MHLLLIPLSKECSWAFSFFPETWDGPTHLKHSRQWVAVTALQNSYIILYQLKHCPKIRWVPSSFPPFCLKELNQTFLSALPSRLPTAPAQWVSSSIHCCWALQRSMHSFPSKGGKLKILTTWFKNYRRHPGRARI